MNSINLTSVVVSAIQARYSLSMQPLDHIIMVNALPRWGLIETALLLRSRDIGRSVKSERLRQDLGTRLLSERQWSGIWPRKLRSSGTAEGVPAKQQPQLRKSNSEQSNSE